MKPKDESADSNPKRKGEVKIICVKKVDIAKDPGTVCTNAIGRFPHPASSGMYYILVMYDYESTAIFA